MQYINYNNHNEIIAYIFKIYLPDALPMVICEPSPHKIRTSDYTSFDWYTALKKVELVDLKKRNAARSVLDLSDTLRSVSRSLQRNKQ